MMYLRIVASREFEHYVKLHKYKCIHKDMYAYVYVCICTCTYTRILQLKSGFNQSYSVHDTRGWIKSVFFGWHCFYIMYMFYTRLLHFLFDLPFLLCTDFSGLVSLDNFIAVKYNNLMHIRIIYFNMHVAISFRKIKTRFLFYCTRERKIKINFEIT